jgi:hypothetical protein
MSAFQQQGVPLEIEEYLACRNEREMEHPDEPEAHRRRISGEKQERQPDSQKAENLDEAPCAKHPAERRHVKEGARAKLLAGGRQKLARRQDARRANEAAPLHPD